VRVLFLCEKKTSKGLREKVCGMGWGACGWGRLVPHSNIEYAELVDLQFKIRESALKHGVTEADIRHAFEIYRKLL
jgi:hypothetical protein